MGADPARIDPAVRPALRPVHTDLLIGGGLTERPVQPASFPDFGAPGAAGPGLIWGVDFTSEGPRPVELCDSPHPGEYRWLHLNLADQGARTWIESSNLPPGARELLLSLDTHQRTLVEGSAVCCILHDLERDFDVQDTARVGALSVALTPEVVITARLHPLGFADIVRQRLDAGARVDGPATALDMLVGAIVQNIASVMNDLSAEVQSAEDHFLEGRPPPGARRLLDIRRRLAQLHRMLDGMQRVFRRLEHDEDLPDMLYPMVEKLSQRVQGLDADSQSIQAQLRVLREEIDLQQDQRTNQNLYLLSIMTALMLPATLVTGLFGMNTGSLPFTGPGGTLVATGIAVGTAVLTYIYLRRKGFFQ